MGQALKEAIAVTERDNKRALARKEIIEKRKEEQERLQLEAEKEEEEKRLIQARLNEAAEEERRRQERYVIRVFSHLRLVFHFPLFQLPAGCNI